MDRDGPSLKLTFSQLKKRIQAPFIQVAFQPSIFRLQDFIDDNGDDLQLPETQQLAPEN